ncbi:MAG: hypothetical protein P8X70_02035 [Nanoarchaeota archaeon]
MRVQFNKRKQREFIQKIMIKINSPSLKELSNRIQISYSTLKNYFNESRNLPENLFKDLCFLANIPKKNFFVKFLKENWGQVKGGKVCS